MRSYPVGEEDIGKRADIFVASRLDEFSRASLTGLFKSNLVTIGRKSIKPGYKLRQGDKIKIDTSPLKLRAEAIDLPVIYEDEDIIVINKPSGILTHSKGALNTEPSVASFIKSKLNDSKLSGNRAGIVHRLDRGTSGVIIAAKNTGSLAWLQKQFSTRKVKKVYHAIVEGAPNPPAAIIDAPIERNPKKPQTFRVGVGGKSAKTEYSLKKRYEKDTKHYSLLELRPLTGRTHQLRVHMVYIGHPVAGDSVYGRQTDKSIPRLMLHAYRLELICPDGKKHIFTAPQPDNFKSFTDQL